MRLKPQARQGTRVVAMTLAFAAVVLAGCSDPAPKAQDAGIAVETAPAAPAPAAPTPPATVGGDGSAITLSPLALSDLEEAKLAGELGCSFTDAATASPMLIAMGNVASRDPAFGVVKVGSYVERVAAPGGFDAMAKGVAFSGAGKTVTIALTGPATGGGESPPRPATLTYDRSDGARLVVPGQWTCGP